MPRSREQCAAIAYMRGCLDGEKSSWGEANTQHGYSTVTTATIDAAVPVPFASLCHGYVSLLLLLLLPMAFACRRAEGRGGG